MASITGALPLAGSYFSATAKWVGLVITTSASGTCCIIRRSAICRCNWRIFDLTSGLPSLSLYSSLTSCLVIINFCLESQSWNGTSTAAMRISPQAIHSRLQPVTSMECRIADSTDSLAMASRSSWSALSTANATIRMMMNLARALSSSTRAWAENMRLIPCKGFMRLNFGCRASPENSQPPTATGPMMEAISMTMKKGCSASSASMPVRSR